MSEIALTVSVLALVFGMGAGRDRLVAVRAEPL